VDSFAAARESAKRLTLRELRRGYSQVVNHLSTTRTI
jgi:hypothetical protein